MRNTWLLQLHIELSLESSSCAEDKARQGQALVFPEVFLQFSKVSTRYIAGSWVLKSELKSVLLAICYQSGFYSGVGRSRGLIDPYLIRGLRSCRSSFLCRAHRCTVKHRLEHPCIKHRIVCWTQIQLAY